MLNAQVKKGGIPKDSWLYVENLDRLTREDVTTANELFPLSRIKWLKCRQKSPTHGEALIKKEKGSNPRMRFDAGTFRKSDFS